MNCECEHEKHDPSGPMSGHPYMVAVAVAKAKTAYGTFPVCQDCLDHCFGSYLEGFEEIPGETIDRGPFEFKTRNGKPLLARYGGESWAILSADGQTLHAIDWSPREPVEVFVALSDPDDIEDARRRLVPGSPEGIVEGIFRVGWTVGDSKLGYSVARRETIARGAAMIRELVAQCASKAYAAAQKDAREALAEALNSGDGSYRP